MDSTELETDISLEHSTEVEKDIQEKLNSYYNDYNLQEMTERIAELDEEWDIERILQLEGTALTIAGVILALAVNKKWLVLPLAGSLVLLAAIATNWGAPLPILRKLGFRTRVEIEKEKYALKAIRGDFKYLLDVPNSVWNAVNK